ncbi:SWIM zinc finger family protein [Gorillibacterium sp. sgz5001074]|uniref:SWIM zinc finger family protein n=1 Tax=Gorillibacterium sp. sgz5001074 TaxID=3446695 RepID=UPI003F6649A9
MNLITEAYVDSLAMNASAIKNGKDLVKKNSFPKLCRSEDDTLLFGECKGSGSEPYRCSVDLAKEGQPVFRCSCPSRQFPCKHLLGLMYAYAGSKPFETAPIPPDILEKREKAEKREEKKAEAAANPAEAPKRKPNKSAQVKKLAAQLDGIALLEKLVLQTAQAGLGSLDKKMLQTLDDQAKQLGNAYVPGLQTALRELTALLRSDEDKERVYTQAAEQLCLLHTLVKKSRDYLQNRAADPELPPDTDSTIEEWIGRAWQLAELRELGRTRSGPELVQLAFRCYSDMARGEYVDEGYWADVSPSSPGGVVVTRTYRPFRAAQYIKEEDSCYEVMKVKELYLYPGELNPRVRWEESVPRPVAPEDLEAVRSQAVSGLAEAVKQVKNQIKNPLSEKHPVLLVASSGILQDSSGVPVLVDPQGKTILLSDLPSTGRPTTPLLPLLKQDQLRESAVLLRFGQDRETNRLTAQPLSIITGTGIVRLLY